VTSIGFDLMHADELRRRNLYRGDLYVFSPTASILDLIDHARAMIEQAYGADPTRAQYAVTAEQFSAIGGPLKPRFIRHPETMKLLKRVVAAHGGDLDDIYIDVPRLRLVTSDGYLTSGVGYAHHPHRDTWYSAPMCQINWWIPIYDFEPESSMAFHLHHFSKPVKNGSASFNYYRWNVDGRRNSGQYIKTDTRQQPKPEEPLELEPQVRPVCRAGGIVMFAAAQLHSTVPNTSGRTRFSLDFRTVSRADLEQHRGPPNLDSHCAGTSLRDFRRGSDSMPLPAELIAGYDSGDAEGGVLVFTPELHEFAATPASVQ
jgi:hypothetical protein